VAVSQRGQEKGGVVLMARRKPPSRSSCRARRPDRRSRGSAESADRCRLRDYDFSWERERAGRDVYVPGWRLPREHRPAGAEVFWLRGDELHPADDTRFR
jgi:hypothetical protein